MFMLRITYYELIDQDFTGVHMELSKNSAPGVTKSEYRNFDSEEVPEDGLWKNQVEEFKVRTLDDYIAIRRVFGMVDV